MLSKPPWITGAHCGTESSMRDHASESSETITQNSGSWESPATGIARRVRRRVLGNVDTCARDFSPFLRKDDTTD